MISGVRPRRIMASPPIMLMAAVAMIVRGQSELAAMPSPRNSSAHASVQSDMPYFRIEYATDGAHDWIRMSSGGESVRMWGFADAFRCGMQYLPQRNVPRALMPFM